MKSRTMNTATMRSTASRLRLDRAITLKLTTVSLLLALAGCAVGPDYEKPKLPLPDSFVGATNSQALPDISAFWRGFGDAKLNALIEHALSANGDVKLAIARLQEARAGRDEADAAFRPTFGAQTDATREVEAVTLVPNTSTGVRTIDVFDANFVSSWELDLFGRIRRGSEAATARAEAGAFSLEAAKTSVSAEVARNYFELRGWQQRLAFAKQSLDSQRHTFELIQQRFNQGRGTALDVARARTLLASTEATVPAIQDAIDHSIFRLATLTAQAPREVLTSLSAPAPLPSLPVTDLSQLPVGTTEQWLQRRPDVRAAERQVQAATAGIGITTSQLYPKLSLFGLIGFNAGAASDLTNSNSQIFNFGATLAWSPFDLGAVMARIKASEARAQQSIVSFENTVNAALEETEGAFSSFSRNAQRTQQIIVAAQAASDAAKLARLQYETGVIDYLAVLDAERQLLSQRDQLVQTQVLTASALVAVYRSLGGGWSGAVEGEPSR